MLWFSKIDKSISYYYASQKVLSILNLLRPVSNVSCTAHTKALEKAANELLEREPKNAMLQVKRYKRTSAVHSFSVKSGKLLSF